MRSEKARKAKELLNRINKTPEEIKLEKNVAAAEHFVDAYKKMCNKYKNASKEFAEQYNNMYKECFEKAKEVFFKQYTI